MTSPELGNITPSDLGILRGKEGYLKALQDFENWQAWGFDNNDWVNYEDWREWPHVKLMDPARQWRRRPAKEEREGMRYTWETWIQTIPYTLISATGLTLTAQAKPGCQWEKRRCRITVEELPAAPVPDYRPCSRQEAEANPECSEWRCRDDPMQDWEPLKTQENDPCPRCVYQTRARPADEPAVEAPGTIITWQRAQERVDAGLAVEASQRNSQSTNPVHRWTEIGRGFLPREFQHWTYRIPLSTPAQPEEVKAEMTGKEAEDWLRLGDRAVLTRKNGIWSSYEHNNGIACTDDDVGPFRPLIPATRTQVELESQLRAMTGSRDAAVAALEQERMHGCWMRNSLELCQKYFGNASVDDLRQLIAKTLRNIDETEGKAEG